jgi:PAS domain S-box-containing protein
MGSLTYQATGVGLAFLECRSMVSAEHVRLSGQMRGSRNKQRSWLYLLILLLNLPLYGIDRDRTLDQLYHTAWTYAEGAPGEVNALAQTTDGYLWLGTATGLFRSDGIRFQLYKPQSGQAFPQRSVVSLFAVPDGGLWVGYRHGGVSFIKNGTVTDYGTEEGLPSRAVLAFARDLQGGIWIAAGKGGLARLGGSRWTKIGTDWGFAGSAYTVFVDHAGTVWVGTPTSVEYLVEGGHQFQIAAQRLLPFVHSFAETPDGTLWMAEGGYGVRPVPLPGKSNGRAGPAVLVGSLAIAFDNQGSLWITSAGNGIRRVPYPERLRPPKISGPSAWQYRNSGVEAFTQTDGLTSDYVHCVLQDREGNVWIGTSGGLDRFRQSPVVSVPLQPISYRGALPIPSLNSFTTSAMTAGDQGALWAAGRGPEVLLKIQKDRIATQLRDRNVDFAYRDPNDVIWLATWRSIFRLSDEGLDTIDSKPGAVTYNYLGALSAGQGMLLRQLDLPKAGGIAVSEQSRVKAITRDQLGRLWIAMESGTFRLERSSWTSLESLGGPQGTATAEFTDSEGRIWFGFANTVAMLDGDRVRMFSGKDGVQVGAVTSIQGKGTKIWIGGEFGLEFFDGSRFQSVNLSDGSAFGGISGIVVDPEDGLWFSENRGIIHIRGAQLRQLGSGKVEFESFGLLDGLTAQLRGFLASPSAAQTTDGRIWFATTKGVAWINPKRIVRNTVPPPVLIQSVIADGRQYNTSTSLRLPPRIKNLQIAYTATSLTIPERVRFRYKLEGQDKEWQDAGTRREAFYTNVDPGSYRFRVIACNNDGVWNEAGTVLQFDVLPAFYQTLTFKILCGLALIAALWSLYRLRVHNIEQRHLERTRAAEALASQAAISLENTRLYRDIEDREGRIRRLVDANIIGIVIWDLDGRLLDANDAFLRMVQYEREDVQTGLRWFDMTPPEWQEAHAQYEAEELKATGMMRAREKEFFRKDGRRVPVLIGAACFEGQPNQGVAYILDLSEQKRAEEALRRSEAYLTEAQRLTNTGSCAIDGTSRETVYWSEEMFRLFGFDSHTGPPKWEQFLERIHPDDRDKVTLASDRTFRTKVKCDVEFRILKPDGTVKHIHGIGDPVLSPNGELIQVLGTMVDVTERKQADEARERLRLLEADLAHINRVSTMGELTASLAHEIKQPIGAAVTNAEACLRLIDRREPDLPEAREAASEMIKDARRAADVIEHVRSLFRKDSSSQEIVDVNEVIREMVVILQKEADRHSVRMSTDLTEGLTRVMADRVQLQQALMNLMLNGMEAMRDATGELSIKSQWGEDGQVLISVTDTGVGVPTENADQIFNAFFTTKSQGTGLGLAITRSIVESHGGRIWATANSGPGATFHFALPISEEAGR